MIVEALRTITLCLLLWGVASLVAVGVAWRLDHTRDEGDSE